MPRRLMRVGLVATLVVFATAQAGAQDPTLEGMGGIRGRIVDASTGQPLSRVQVFVEGTPWSGATDLNGRYTIGRIPTGVYRVIVRQIGYTPKTVTGVVVATDEVVSLDITLSASVIQLSTIEVSAEVERGSALALIDHRKAASVLTNAIGSEEIGRSPDSDAAGALKRVTGVTIVEDRSLVIRGLQGRYSSARLNGAPLPSTDPDRNSVPLDLFPSAMLESIVAMKTYTPDQPGDYTGGVVDIRTKDFPGGRSAKLSFGTSWNSNTSFKDGLRYQGGDLDFLGVDDGTRAIPDLVPTDIKVIDALVGDQQLQDIGRSFSSVWEPRPNTQPVNQSASLSLADQTNILGTDVSLLAAGTYSNSYSTKDLIERILVTAAADEEPETDYTGAVTERTVRWSLFGRSNLLFSPTHQLTVRSLYTRTSDDQARELAGYNRDRNTNLQNYRLRFISRSMWSNTVEGDHLLGMLGDTRFHWRAGYARATSDEPDRREVVYEEIADGRFIWRELTNSGLRYFTSLADRDYSGSADVTVPVGRGEFKLGGLYLDKDRDFFTRRFRYRTRGPLGNAAFMSPDQLFSSDHIAPNLLELEEDTRRTDNYDADQRTRAAYAMVDLPIDILRISGGVRLENVEQTVIPYDLFDLGLPAVDSARIDNTDALPAINITVAPTDAINVRAAFSRTVARPEFREQAPFDFVDFAGGFLQVGNPALVRSSILNYDLRVEWFPEPTSLVAVSGFYKDFDHPIEQIVFPSSELISTWDNNESASLYGAEIELRTSLRPFVDALENFSIAGNLTLVHSRVQSKDSLQLSGGESIAITPRERALQGQSPYVINGSLTYFHPSGRTTITALFNRFGQRIDKVGTQVLPDVFENPINQLDMVVQQGFGRVSLRLAGSNLMNADAVYEQAGQVVRRATRGRSVSASLSFGLGST